MLSRSTDKTVFQLDSKLTLFGFGSNEWWQEFFWKYVLTKQNTVDIVSRGCYLEEFNISTHNEHQSSYAKILDIHAYIIQIVQTIKLPNKVFPAPLMVVVLQVDFLKLVEIVHYVEIRKKTKPAFTKVNLFHPICRCSILLNMNLKMDFGGS